MASFLFDVAAEGMEGGTIALQTDDIRLLLLEVATGIVTTDANLAACNLAVTELNSTGYVGTYDYASGGVALTNQTVGTITRAFDSTDTPTWSAISLAGSEVVAGLLVFKWVDGTAGNDIPISFHDDYTNMPLTPNGGDITITFSASGIIALA